MSEQRPASVPSSKPPAEPGPTSRPHPDHDSAPTLGGETLEPRILMSVTWIVGSSADDSLAGTDGNDRLIGGDGADMIDGGGGDDLLLGGLGDDTLIGGTGIDIVEYSTASGGVAVDLGAGSASGADGNDTLTDVEGVIGSSFDDLVVMSRGDDFVDGGAGNDRIDFSGAAGPIIVDLTATGAQDTGDGTDTLSNVEGVIGSAFRDTFRFANAAARDHFLVDGGSGGGTIDLGNFRSTAAQCTADSILVDLGGGESFRISYGNIDTLSFADRDIDVATLAPSDGAAAATDAGVDQTVDAGELVTLDATGSYDPRDPTLSWRWVQTSGPTVTLDDDTAANPTFTAPDLGRNTTVTFAVAVSDGTTTTTTDAVTVRIGDWLEGTDDVDLVSGSDGNARIRTFGGDDVVSGGAGDDHLDGGDGIDTIDYRGATAAVTVDLTLGSSQDTGGDGIDTLQNFERVVGSGFDDVFAFREARDGAYYFVDGGGGTNTIDLSGFDSSAITFGDGVVRVDLGGGQTFQVEYQNVQTLQFGDVTAEVLTGSPDFGSLTGSRIFLDGGTAFRLDVQGAGSVSWSYDTAADSLSILDTDGAGVTTTIVLANLNATDMRLAAITLDEPVGTIVSDVDLDVLHLTGGGQLGRLELSGGAGTLGLLSTADGNLHAPLTIEGNVAAIALPGDVQAGLHVTGDVTSLSLGNVTAPLQVDGDVRDFTAQRIGDDVTFGGDVGTAILDDVRDGASVTIDAVVGTLDFQVAGVQYGGQFDSSTTYSFDGTTQAATTVSTGNAAPVAIAAASGALTVAEGDRVQLDATGSSDADGDTLSYRWVQTGGPSVRLDDPSAARPSFIVPELLTDTTLTFELQVSDGDVVRSDTITLSVAADNDAPVLQMGPDQTVLGGAEVTLRAQAVDPEAQTVTYQWRQTGGPDVVLGNATSARPRFVAPDLAAGTTLNFEVRATDGSNRVIDTVTVVVMPNRAPEVEVTALPVVTSGDIAVVGALARDADGDALHYRWSQVGGPSAVLGDTSGTRLSFTAPTVRTPTDLTFRVEVGDGAATTTEYVVVSIAPVDSQPSSPTSTAVVGAAIETSASTDDSRETTGETTGDEPADAREATLELGGATSGQPAASSAGPTASSVAPVRLTNDQLHAVLLADETGASSDATTSSETTASSTLDSGATTSLDGAATPVTHDLEANLLRGALLDGAATDAADADTVLVAPDLVFAEAGDAVELLPRLADGSAAGAANVDHASYDDVRWKQIAGTPIAIEGVAGAALRVQLPELFLEEELVFEVELWRNGERTVQEITVQVQPVTAIGRSLAIDDHFDAEHGDASSAADVPTGGIGKLWGALLAFLGAQPRRRDEQ